MNDFNVATQSKTAKVPQVSIGMPVYNGAKFIREALDSLLVQTFTDFELIISDNTSTDETEAICREYAAKDERIRYVRQAKNLGPVANFKFVLDEAVGDYFMWAAHDDRRHFTALERMMEVFSENADVGLVFSDMETKNLLTKSKVYSSCGYIAGTAKNYKKYIFRLLNGCPSLIYGLHRRLILKNFKLTSYDFMDVHLTHWYELNSSIKAIPLLLYTAGTDGVRKPYSITGTRLSNSHYLKEEWKLLRQHFNLFAASVQFIIVVYLAYKNSYHLHKHFWR